jgi:CRISPR-associated protein Cas5h
MEALRFDLKGKNAFFKTPEVNTYYYFSYGNIHKPALLGLFGGILGYQGYGQDYQDYPEYYEKLQDIKVAVIPNAEKGYFPKKIQYFNNSVGYASAEQGGNLIVKEQWLDNPSWSIYVLSDGEESRKLVQMILEQKCVYIPYLGKNDHPAIIENPVMVSVEEKIISDERIHSLVPAENVIYDWDEMTFKYEEFLPYGLTLETNHYILKKFIFTDAPAENCEDCFSDGDRNLVFF